MIGLSSTRRMRFAIRPPLVTVIQPGTIVRRRGVAAAKTKIEVLFGRPRLGLREVPAAIVLERARDGADAAHHGDVAKVALDAVVVVEDLLHEDGALLVAVHEGLRPVAREVVRIDGAKPGVTRRVAVHLDLLPGLVVEL